MRLTKNFTLEELCASDTAKRMGIDNKPSAVAESNLLLVARNILQPLRDAYGKSIVINSGYRCPALNKAVGGASTSQHLKGEAVDIRCNNKETREWIFNWIKANCKFDQLILEHNSQGVYWVHVSYRRTGNRKQVIGNLLKK